MKAINRSNYNPYRMSDKKSFGGKNPAPARQEPGRNSADLKPKKAAAHRQVIQDAAKYNQLEQQASTGTSSVCDTNVADDYEGGKVNRRRGSKYEDDIQMVKDLDRWG